MGRLLRSVEPQVCHARPGPSLQDLQDHFRPHDNRTIDMEIWRYVWMRRRIQTRMVWPNLKWDPGPFISWKSSINSLRVGGGVGWGLMGVKNKPHLWIHGQVLFTEAPGEWRRQQFCYTIYSIFTDDYPRLSFHFVVRSSDIKMMYLIEKSHGNAKHIDH